MGPTESSTVQSKDVAFTPLMRFRRAISGFSVNAILMAFSAACIFPVIWIIYSSFKTNREFAQNIIGLPETLLLENFEAVLAGGRIFGFMFNTARNTALTLFGVIFCGFIVGYFFARFSFKGRTLLYFMFLLGLLMPIHSIIVPIYILFSQLNITSRWYTLLFPYIAFGLPLAIFIIESYIRSVPRELEEAAAIDGSSFTRTLFSIVMPICMPVLVTVGIIQFFATWNEFIFALLLIGEESLVTLPVGLARFFRGQFSAHYPRMMSAMVVSIFPPMVLYFAFSKRIIEGMVAGAVKG